MKWKNADLFFYPTEAVCQVGLGDIAEAVATRKDKFIRRYVRNNSVYSLRDVVLLLSSLKQVTIVKLFSLFVGLLFVFYLYFSYVIPNFSE